jgi:hypothetical protein
VQGQFEVGAFLLPLRHDPVGIMATVYQDTFFVLARGEIESMGLRARRRRGGDDGERDTGGQTVL